MQPDVLLLQLNPNIDWTTTIGMNVFSVVVAVVFALLVMFLSRRDS